MIPAPCSWHTASYPSEQIGATLFIESPGLFATQRGERIVGAARPGPSVERSPRPAFCLWVSDGQQRGDDPSEHDSPVAEAAGVGVLQELNLGARISRNQHQYKRLF